MQFVQFFQVCDCRDLQEIEIVLGKIGDIAIEIGTPAIVLASAAVEKQVVPPRCALPSGSSASTPLKVGPAMSPNTCDRQGNDVPANLEGFIERQARRDRATACVSGRQQPHCRRRTRQSG